MFRPLFALWVFFLFPTLLSARETLRVYPAPPGETLSARYVVTADGRETPVYTAAVSSLDPAARRTLNARSPSTDAAFTSFDLRGTVKITVKCRETVRDVVILPSARGLQPVVAGNEISFTVSQPGALVLEINGNWKNSLQLFANPWDDDAPDPNDPNVIYYGPGLHEVKSVEVPSGKTVYIAGGAVIYGRSVEGENEPIFNLKGDHITLRGRGIIDGSRCADHTRNMIVIEGRDIRLEGVVLRDSSTWNVPVLGSDRVRINNLKILGYRANSDGIDINNSRQVDVGDCFLRTFDDLVVIKSSARDRGVSTDITVHHCVLWNEFAHALSLGAELRLDVERVRFTDCDIIRDKGREWALGVYHCDAGHVRDIAFDRIRIEDGQRLLSVWIGLAAWSRDTERGHVDNVLFQNITTNAPEPLAKLGGFDAAHAVRGVKFENVQSRGRPLRSAEVKRNEFVREVTGLP